MAGATLLAFFCPSCSKDHNTDNSQGNYGMEAFFTCTDFLHSAQLIQKTSCIACVRQLLPQSRLLFTLQCMTALFICCTLLASTKHNRNQNDAHCLNIISFPSDHMKQSLCKNSTHNHPQTDAASEDISESSLSPFICRIYWVSSFHPFLPPLPIPPTLHDGSQSAAQFCKTLELGKIPSASSIMIHFTRN